MADFASVRNTFLAVDVARPVWADVQNLLLALRKVDAHLARYQTDADFQARVRAVFTASQMVEMGQVAGKVRMLLADLEGNHRSLFGL